MNRQMGNPAWIRELDSTYVYTAHGIRLIADAISCWLRLAFLLMLSTFLTDRIVSLVMTMNSEQRICKSVNDPTFKRR